jgi:ferredoxin
VEGGFLLQAVTEKGAALLSSSRLQSADDAKAEAAKAARAAVTASMGEVPDLSAAPAALLALFDNKEFWQAQSAGCLSCGACTYLCPTCYCFNITDESNGISGVRMRSWDTCMSALFTLEASGHNPRANKAARLRNRVGHKFSYYPDIHGGRFSCSGCGRCIKSCPSSVDIRKIVSDAVKAR